MVVIPRTESGLFPAELSIEGNGGSVGFGNFQKNGAASVGGNRRKEGRGDSAAPETRIHRQVQDLGFIFRALPPGTEASGDIFYQREQKWKRRIIAERPLRGFRAAALDAGDGRVIAFERGTDCYGAQFREHGISERPARG